MTVQHLFNVLANIPGDFKVKIETEDLYFGEYCGRYDFDANTVEVDEDERTVTIRAK